MKKLINLVMVALFAMVTFNLSAQYCVPPPFITGPYTGITNVNLETLDNTSAYNVGVMYYSSVAAPSITQGIQYSFSITTYDIAGMGQNIRIWIDWNQDLDFDDVGEEVLFWNDQTAGTLTKNFTVPAGATVGTTRMRVYADMPESGGHITPVPCGYLDTAGHAIGMHGEVEDYDVKIIAASTGINVGSQANELMIYPNPAVGKVFIKVKFSNESPVRVAVKNMLGQEVSSYESNMVSNGYTDNIDLSAFTPGIYFLQVTIGAEIFMKKIIVE